MRRVLLAILMLVVFRCAAPAPPGPAAAPPPPTAVAPPLPVEEPVIGTVRVTASALNVRQEASTDSEVIAQAKKGQMLSVLAEDESWVRVKLANGEKGFVAARFVTHQLASTKKKTPRKTGCPADSDFAFVETPTLAFSETPKPGMVVVEASVNTKGSVTATKVVSNSTGDEAMAFLAQREIRSATFAPPIRNCVPRAFIFTYRRTF